MKTIDLNVRENVRRLQPYASARSEFQQSDAVFLDANENPFGALNRYPDPVQSELKQALASQFSLRAEQLFVGNGSDEVIDLLFRIFCEPNKDKAATFVPTYGMYRVSAAINNVGLIEIPLDNQFDLDLASFGALLSDPDIRLLFLCTPNNPTGNVFTRERIESLLDQFEGIVCIDEAYIDFADTPSFTTVLDRYPNLVVARTLSKAWGLAGARIGIACASEEIIAYFNKVKPPYNVSSLNQRAALDVLEQKDTIRQRVETLRNERIKLQTQLEQLPFVQHIFPSQTNFLLVQFDDPNAVYAALLERDIVVRNRDREVPGCLRITTGSPKENALLLETLKNSIT